MPEYCGTISDKPSTGAKLEDILEEEKNISDSILDTAFENRKMEFVKDIPENNSLVSNNEIERVTQIQKDEIVIDVREEALIKKQKLKAD